MRNMNSTMANMAGATALIPTTAHVAAAVGLSRLVSRASGLTRGLDAGAQRPTKGPTWKRIRCAHVLAPIGPGLRDEFTMGSGAGRGCPIVGRDRVWRLEFRLSKYLNSS